MEHLPPSGWSDVVRLNDLVGMEQRFELRMNILEVRFDGLELRMNGFEKRLDAVDKRLNALDTKIGRSAFALAGLIVAAAVPILTILLQMKTNTG